MAGRGRGRANMTFSIEAVGIGRGESLPPSVLQPTPLFPPMEHKPVPLATGEEVEYMQALKQEFRGAMKSLPFFIRPAAPKKDVERYSDKYHSGEPADNMIDWKPDWGRLPKELRIRVRRPQGRSLPVKRLDRTTPTQNLNKTDDGLLKLEALEKKEKAGSSEEEDEEDETKKKQKEEETEAEEEYDEEEFEEGTDYIMSYFDNGEEFGADSDDNMDEAVY